MATPIPIDHIARGLHPPLWKSLAIIGYLTFVVAAALVDPYRLPLAKYAFPWHGYKMFPSASPTHLEHALEGIAEDGTHLTLGLNAFFPMPLQLISRGQGFGITYGTNRYFFNTSQEKSSRLCRYVLHKYNERIVDRNQMLKTLAVKFRSYPLSPNGWQSQKPMGERVLATCAADFPSNWL